MAAQKGQQEPSSRGTNIDTVVMGAVADSLKRSHKIVFVLRKDLGGFCVDDGMEGAILETGSHPGRDEKAELSGRQRALLLLLLFIKMVALG